MLSSAAEMTQPTLPAYVLAMKPKGKATTTSLAGSRHPVLHDVRLSQSFRMVQSIPVRDLDGRLVE